MYNAFGPKNLIRRGGLKLVLVRVGGKKEDEEAFPTREGKRKMFAWAQQTMKMRKYRKIKSAS